MRAYLVTGSSSGLGAALVSLLLERGHIVFGMARTERPEHAAVASGIYRYVRTDLAELDALRDAVHSIMVELSSQNIEDITLVNNAATVQPLVTIEGCGADDLVTNVHTNLSAPMILTSCFLEATERLPIAKTIVNVVSGSAKFPAPGMSVYCSAKAGLLMFTKCVALEQEPRRYPARVVAFDPGMMDTPMQAQARSTDFPMNGFFTKAAEEGQLADVVTVARRLLERLDDAENGEVISV